MRACSPRGIIFILVAVWPLNVFRAPLPAGKTSATASLGMITLWDVEGGLPQIDKYLYSKDPAVVAGALLAVGIVNSGVRDECDPAYALLYDSVQKEDSSVRLGAILGLALAYAGTQKEEVQELLVPLVTDSGGWASEG